MYVLFCYTCYRNSNCRAGESGGDGNWDPHQLLPIRHWDRHPRATSGCQAGRRRDKGRGLILIDQNCILTHSRLWKNSFPVLPVFRHFKADVQCSFWWCPLCDFWADCEEQNQNDGHHPYLVVVWAHIHPFQLFKWVLPIVFVGCCLHIHSVLKIQLSESTGCNRAFVILVGTSVTSLLQLARW